MRRLHLHRARPRAWIALCAAAALAALAVVWADGAVSAEPLTVAAQGRLAVSLFVPDASGPATQHAQAREITYVGSGDSVLAVSGERFAPQSVSWYFLAGLDVLAPARELGTVVTFGDSITDGVGSSIGADARWPNDLARRLAALGGNTLAVVDEGIGGNRVLNDTPCCGAGAVARFGRDIAEVPGARDVILLEGVNDINSPRKAGRLSAPHVAVSALQIVDGYEQIIALAHAARLRIFGATLTPFQGSRYWTRAQRQSASRSTAGSGPATRSTE